MSDQGALNASSNIKDPSKFDIRNASLDALEAWFTEQNEPPYRAKQVYRWVHQRGVRSFDEMTDLSKKLRETLKSRAYLQSLKIERREIAQDGTRKYALKSESGHVVEAVFIPDASSPGRNSLCISSQVGCAVDCQFCLTASLGLIRNLGPGEIAEQIVRVKEDLQGPQEDDRENNSARIGNIVFMGMGEPLQNYKGLIQALQILTHDMGQQYSPRRITVSTSGIVPRIEQLGREMPVQLAISLNATTDEVRSDIMPINRRWNIQALLEACRQYPLSERRRITFEYVLLADINDSESDARRLVKLLKGIRCKVNLIPFNEHPYSPYKRPAAQQVAHFQAILRKAGYTVLVRTPRGDDISAACGQLGVEVDAPRVPANERTQRLKVVQA